MASLLRELRLALKDRVVIFTLLGVALLSVYSLSSGLKESASERLLIERVKEMVTDDRQHNIAKQTDAGGAAYYAFHFTYAPPSSLAFVSRGVRDDLPWKHRIRMLALEGQIYETDAGNPELSRIGKLDFAFVAAFLLPLLSILLLYDLRAAELRDNRWALVSATFGSGGLLLFQRTIVRSGLLFACAVIPFLFFALINGANAYGSSMVIAAVLINVVFWGLLAMYVSNKIESGPTVAAVLLGFWFTFAVAVPVAGKYIVERSISVPKGGEILLSQREAVNNGWDLPKEATMTPFVERHPQWRNQAKVSTAFEWKWYYAFQQVGDQSVEHLSNALRSGVAQRDKAMTWVSLVSPPLLTKRLLSRAGKTDISTFLSYDSCVRNYHASLREFYYPMLFEQVAYSAEQIAKLPVFEPCSD